MATALYTPERAAVASSVHHIDGPVDYLASLDDTTASHHGTLPPPNPHFAFPAASPSSTLHDPTTKRRRPLSAVEMHTRSLSIAVDGSDPRHAALPAFSFNPGASLPPKPHSFLSPPHSPSSAQPPAQPAAASANRPMGHGHRRGGSEFVGGRLREGSTIAVMSTSPPKNEFDMKVPTLQPPPRRGHRRGMSATIPATDLPILFAPPAIGSFSQGNSAPNSPTMFSRKDDLPNIGSDFPLPEPVRLGQDDGNTDSPRASKATPGERLKMAKPNMRARVGFSDTLEFIPRPLSLVSNETSSTVTARPGHSGSGSVSSIISISSLSGRDGPNSLLRTPTGEPYESRPSTAGAILERTAELQMPDEPPTSPRRRNSIPALVNIVDADGVESNVSTPTKPAKRWSFFGLDAFASGSPMKRRPSTSSSSSSTPRPIDGISCSDRGSASSLDTTEALPAKSKKGGKKSDKKRKKREKKEKKKDKEEEKEKEKEGEKKEEKEKKAKGWAGSILPLKSHKKRGKSHVVRPPTPPASVSHLDDEEEDELESDIRQPPLEPPTISITESPSLPEQPEPPKRSSDDMSYPMIDLDAALGPFNTPLSYNAEWEAAQRAAGTPGSRRRLHSAQGLKGFSGPGMHYHRRAESAPDLPPFDFRSTIHRFGSSSTMADVFEEDEEDEDGKGNTKSKLETSEEVSEESDGEATPPAITPVLQEPFLGPSDKVLGKMRRGSAGLVEGESSSLYAVRAEASLASLHDETITEEDFTFFRAPVFQGRRDSVDSGAPSAPSPRQVPVTADLPIDDPLVLPSASGTPLSPYSASYISSSHPSPRSPMSVDAQRISTAPSSITDDSFHSLLMGEPGPEVRISMDYDAPSLASSHSAMTRDSTFIPVPRPRQLGPSRDQRPVSMSAPFGRRRSSLASLSRLISSSHGERSKLSMEVTLDNEPESRKSKHSKTKRLGRMMQFWKPSKEDKVKEEKAKEDQAA
ncbi:hypothetical protein TGAM01_v209388 [Trichoderma gamsii]|uniref:Cell wall proline rich protein n=1 Tax=Trichoderma gamsii TaxID=398673 RepID=A0A2P4ZC32_9HYPO|nr:hypothetical protein TGAM01_v209388 [Trichoderma gamsii]PON21801.1 hypothetical protein TGAM01_v209388 [Trichoderma gamsii]